MKLKHATVVVIIAAIIAGCILAAGCVSQETPGNDTQINNSSAEKTLHPMQIEDPNKTIEGDWCYTFMDSQNAESSLTYHFNNDNTGYLSTNSKTTGTGKTSTHWLYDETKNSYMINYDTLGQQEYMAAYTDDDGQLYLVSLGGGYICKKL